MEKKELPHGSVVKNPPASAGDADSIPAWLRKIPWRRKGQSFPVFLPGKSHGQRSLLGSSMGSQELALEVRTDSPDESGMQTRDPCRPWRATLDPGHKPRLGLFCPAVTLVQSPAPPRNPNGRLDPALLPGESHGRRSLVGCSPWGREESDTTERLHFQFSLSCIGEGNGNPLQCSCLESPRDGGAWWAAIYGVAQSRTQLK